MKTESRFQTVGRVLQTKPAAVAVIRGIDPQLRGTVRFYSTRYGVLVAADIGGLPLATADCTKPVFGFHIHEGTTCTGPSSDPFADVGSHYNPDDCPHPSHAGDLPPLFEAGGRAFTAFLTDRFTVREIIGKTVIIHSSPDDFTTQPAGNAGTKIACGEIVAMR